MDAKKQLYYLLEHYQKGNYTTEDFVNEFNRIYNLELDYSILSKKEQTEFKKLVKSTNYFSLFESDLNLPPGFYCNEEDIRSAAEEVYRNLIVL